MIPATSMNFLQGQRPDGHKVEAQYMGYNYMIVTDHQMVRWYADFPTGNFLEFVINRTKEVFEQPDWEEEFERQLGIAGEITYANVEDGVCRVGGFCCFRLIEPNFDETYDRAELCAKLLIELLAKKDCLTPATSKPIDIVSLLDTSADESDLDSDRPF